jgi:hypothetical protein
MAAAGPSRSDLLSLYRRMLRSAAVFPSRNRAGLVVEIKAEWRANAGLEPSPRRDAQIALAADGLRQLDAYGAAAAAPGEAEIGPGRGLHGGSAGVGGSGGGGGR